MSHGGWIVAAAVADTVAVVAHGVIGYRWAADQLRAVQLPASALFGDAEVGIRVFRVTWHVVTAMFVMCAAVLYGMAFGGERNEGVLLFIASLHAAAILVALLVFVRRMDAVLRPIPPVFFVCMTTVTVGCWLAGR